MKRQYVLISTLIVMTASLVACGYQFAGSGSYPAGISKVFITVLENRSAETGVESTFTNDLIYEFTRNREESLARNKGEADGILGGRIVRISVETITRSSVETAVERRVTGVLALQLASPAGRVLWRSGDIVESQAYDVVDGNKTATDQKKKNAIEDVSRKLAEAAFKRLTDDF